MSLVVIFTRASARPFSNFCVVFACLVLEGIHAMIADLSN